MEKRRTILAVVAGILLILLWPSLMRIIGTRLGYDMTPRVPTTQEVAPVATTQPTTSPSTSQPTPASAISPSTSPAAATSGLRVAPAPLSLGVSLGSAASFDPNYAMQLNLTARGGGVDSVVLNAHRRTVDRDERYVMLTAADSQNIVSLATQAVLIDGQRIDTASAEWKLETSDANSATFSASIIDATGPRATVRKKFTITPRPAGSADGSLGLDVKVEQTITNASTGAIVVQSVVNGPNLPPSELEYGPDRQTLTGYFDKSRVTADGLPLESFTASAASHKLLTNSSNVPAVWVGTASTYFAAIVRPSLGDATAMTERFDDVSATIVNPNAKHGWERAVHLTMRTKPASLAPGAVDSLTMQVYFGPRKREILTNAYYAKPYERLDTALVISRGPCSFCVFDSLIRGLVWLLRGFHFVLRDWGLAIMALVCLVRLLLHPITRKSQLSMMKMAKLGPEMAKIKEKYANDKEAQSKAMMQFYRQTGFSPIAGCLPQFLQMPIWIALWSALNTTFELRHAPFLWGYTWIDDLAAPDHLINFGRDHSFDLLFFHFSGLNLLPILLAAVFFIQMKTQPKPAASSPEMEQQQKIMMFLMPVMFPLVLYSQPSGLNLYILASTTIGIIESKKVREHQKRLEALEAAGATIVDAPAGSRRDGSAAKPGWLARKLAEWQDKAEQYKRDADKQNRGRKR